MPNRQLTDEERERLFLPLFDEVRRQLDALSNGDVRLVWALRRKLYKELIYLERGKPMHRVRLKKLKRLAQDDLCALCNHPLPARGSVLDRLDAMAGYTEQNTRVLCATCDQQVQVGRGFA